MSAALEAWLERQYRRSAHNLLEVISPVFLSQERPAFGQRVRGARGAVVASPVLAHYDPRPDYFFHWFRDSALVMDALRVLYASGATAPAAALRHVADFVEFTTRLLALDGRRLVEDDGWRQAVAPAFVKFLREPADLAAVHDDAVLAESRANADGTLDFTRWNRPQYDGAPLLALALLRWLAVAAFPPATHAAIAALLRTVLASTHRHARDACFDIWEEEYGRHYYHACVTAAALAAGAEWSAAVEGDAAVAQAYRGTAGQLRQELDDFWMPQDAFYRSRFVAGGDPDKTLDSAVLLASVHAGDDGMAGAHTARDPRLHAALARLEAYFAQAFPINHVRPAGVGVALGRYPHDIYYSGGAWPICTLAAAELCFRASAGSAQAAAWVARGDGFLSALQRLVPAGGVLAEQYDPEHGTVAATPQLGWSDAAFITACHARRAALEQG